jgi:hypothetical protein
MKANYTIKRCEISNGEEYSQVNKPRKVRGIPKTRPKSGSPRKTTEGIKELWWKEKKGHLQ